MKLLIERYSDSGTQTIGEGYIIDDEGFSQFNFNTLELSWKDNARMESCIPVGNYKVVKRYSDKYKNHFHILDVPDRSYILIHSGNRYTHTKGCILVGSDLRHLDNDNEIDVINSRNTLDSLLEQLPDAFELTIVRR